MAVDRREKASDEKYLKALGTRPPLTNREPELEDVIEDLRDDVNALSTLSATNEGKDGITSTQSNGITESLSRLGGMALAYIPANGRVSAKLQISYNDHGVTKTALISMK